MVEEKFNDSYLFDDTEDSTKDVKKDFESLSGQIGIVIRYRGSLRVLRRQRLRLRVVDVNIGRDITTPINLSRLVGATVYYSRRLR